MPEGMTLRDWFAGMAMKQILKRGASIENAQNQDIVAMFSYALADAMLAARETKTEEP